MLAEVAYSWRPQRATLVSLRCVAFLCGFSWSETNKLICLLIYLLLIIVVMVDGDNDGDDECSQLLC